MFSATTVTLTGFFLAASAVFYWLGNHELPITLIAIAAFLVGAQAVMGLKPKTEKKPEKSENPTTPPAPPAG